MRKPSIYERSVELDAPVDAVFAFHGDVHNVGKISPGWQKVSVERGEHAPRRGEEFEIVVRFFGWLPMRWRGVWEEVSAPTAVVDRALKSPFAFWRHHHEFQGLPGGRTRMTDRVEYLFPGGLLGKWFGETLGRLQFHFMFADRHARTRRWMHDQSLKA